MHTTDPRLDRGIAVVSIDTELAWGEAHRPRSLPPLRSYDREREVVDRVLALFATYGIPGTWAVVGHLFLDRCAPVDGRPHPEVVRPAYAWMDEDWLAVDPGTTLTAAPDRYGRDLVERILRCPVPQEVGCHSWSHLLVGEDGCSAEAFATDLAACAAAAATLGVELRSFVFPRNSIGHLDVLAAAGYLAYRGRPPTPFRGASGAGRTALRAVDRLRPLPGSAVRPRLDATGMWDVPQTHLFAPATHLRRLPVPLWVRPVLARARQAARERSLFHLWFHPYNLTDDPPRALGALERVCAELARLRDAGRLDLRTMAQAGVGAAR